MIEVRSNWMIKFLLCYRSSMFLNSVTKSSFCFSNVDKVRAKSTHEFVDYISGLAVDGAVDFPLFFCLMAGVSFGCFTCMTENTESLAMGKPIFSSMGPSFSGYLSSYQDIPNTF